jgi:hypothetical protein
MEQPSHPPDSEFPFVTSLCEVGLYRGKTWATATPLGAMSGPTQSVIEMMFTDLARENSAASLELLKALIDVQHDVVTNKV